MLHVDEWMTAKCNHQTRKASHKKWQWKQGNPKLHSGLVDPKMTIGGPRAGGEGGKVCEVSRN